MVDVALGNVSLSSYGFTTIHIQPFFKNYLKMMRLIFNRI